MLSIYKDPSAAWVEVFGKDRATFLHGMGTADTKNLQPGSSIILNFLSPKGMTLAYARLDAAGDRWFLRVPTAWKGFLLPHLQKYILASHVKLEDQNGTIESFFLVGDSAGFVLTTLLGKEAVPAAPGEIKTVEKDSQTAYVVWPKGYAVPLFEIVGNAQTLSGLKEKIRSSHVAMTDLTHEAWEAIRIESGIPEAGTDFSGDHLPLEVAYLETDISYTKGCYVGQETIIRMKHRGGQVARILRGVVFESGSTRPAGLSLSHGDKVVGTTLSGCVSGKLKKPLSLAFIHRESAAPGTQLTVGPQGEMVQVIELPVNI